MVLQFSKYLDSIGISAWILPKNYYPAGQQYVPHIYTPEELRRFFAETDKCRLCPEVPYRHLVMPEFFRLLLSCGLRCSEARLLTVRDVDLHQGILTVRDSKNHNSRLVPMPESMTLRLRRYAGEVHPFPEPSGYFFPGYGGKPMTLGNIYKNFRRFLWKAGIPPNPVLVLTGKGNKTRRVPVMKNTAALVEAYISENRLDLAHKASYPLFTNRQHNRLTKEGVAYIINKYAVMAHEISDKVPEKVKCHMLRHSKAVHLLQAGVNLIYIRDFLGHSDIKTTEIYARADTELKRKALENAYPDLVDSNLPDWSENGDLMEWLSEL